MVVLVKQYESAKLLMVEMKSTGDDAWSSQDGEYTATFSKDEFETGGTVLVRVPKK